MMMKKLYFIDFEYGSYNYRGFDIGNHFNEHAGYECDYNLFPNKDEQCHFFRHYLEHDKSQESRVWCYKQPSIHMKLCKQCSYTKGDDQLGNQRKSLLPFCYFLEIPLYPQINLNFVI